MFLRSLLFLLRALTFTIALSVGVAALLTPQSQARTITAALPVTAPAMDGATVSGTYSFAVDASGLPNVATVEFDIGSLRLGIAAAAPYQVSWNTGYGKDGNYSVQAIARDASGRVVATGERTFNIANAGVTMYVSSPDLSQVLSGRVSFQAPANDPINYPAIFHLFVDGEESGYWDVGSSPVTHTTTAAFSIDTTKFSNGRHELVIDLNGWKETTPSHTYTNYSAMLDRIITINNGHTLMEIAANYQNVYLQPGQSVSLSCRDLFTDGTSSACTAPAYNIDNPAVAYVSSSGKIDASNNGFATVTLNDSGKAARAYVSVRSTFDVPHFSGSGQLLNSYQPGSSIFPVAPFVLDPVYMQSGAIVEETKRAAINTLTFGFYLNPRSTSASYSSWQSWQDAVITSRIQWAKDNRFHIIATGDDGFRRPGDDAWWTLNWPYGQQATQYAMQTLVNSGVGIAVDVVDEAAMLWGWYPVNPSKVGQQGLPGQPGSFQSVSCSGGACTVNWPNHGYSSGRWIALQGSIHPELNTLPGQPLIVQHASQNTFDFVLNAPISGTLTSSNDPNLELMLFAAWPCNAGSADGTDHPCKPFTPNDAVKTYANWLHNGGSRVSFSWPALGSLPPPAHANWVGKPAVDQGISEYASHYWDVSSGSRTYSWSAGVQQRTFWMKNAFYSRQPYVAQDRPQLMLVCGSSFAYIKQNPSSAYYNPLTDTLDQPGCDGPIASAEIMTAVALGNAGVREYQFDTSTPSQRAAYPAGVYLQTGMRPDATERNSKEIWQATGYAANLLTNVLEPYILGAAANSPAYQRNITTAVRRGSDATMLMIVNGNDADQTVSVDFTPYKSGADITRYRLSYLYLQSDLLPDSSGEIITLPKGGSVVYLFPSTDRTKFLQPAFMQPNFPAGASQASLSYNYIYSEQLSQLTDGLDCTSGCSLQIDTRLGDVYYQFTYSDANGKLVGRSDVAKLKTLATLNLTAASLNQIYDGAPKPATATTNPAGLTVNFTYDGSTTAPVRVGTYLTVATIVSPNYQGSSNGTLTIRDATPPKVTAPPSILVPATEAGGVRGGSSAQLATFLAGGSAVDDVDSAPQRLPPQVAGVDAGNATLFPIGTTAVTFRFRDAAGNIGSATANVNVFDSTPPTIIPQITGDAGNDGWYRGDVKILWTIADPESGIRSAAGCTPVTVTGETAGTSFSCSAVNGAGLTSAAVVLIKIDKTPPETSIQFDPLVKTVQLTGSDVLSGVPAAPVTGACVLTTWGSDEEDLGTRNGGLRDDPNNARLCTYTIIDAAGNKLVLLEKIKEPAESHSQTHELKVRVISTQYNNGPVIAPQFNQQLFNWSSTKDGTLKELVQTMVIGRGKDRSEVTATFDSIKNQTVIKTKDGKPPTVVKSRAMLRMVTHQGALAVGSEQ